MADGEECSLFEPQSYLKDRCKKCFKLKSKHPIEENLDSLSRKEKLNSINGKKNSNNNINNKDTPTINGGITRSPGKVVATRTKSDVSNTKSIKDNNIIGIPTSKSEKRRSFNDHTKGSNECGDDNDEDTASLMSYKSAYSKGLSSAKSFESIISNMDTRSMVTAVSGSMEDDDRAVTPTEDNNITISTIIADDKKDLERDVARLTEEVRKLKMERDRWVNQKCGTVEGSEAEQSLIEFLEERLLEAENTIQDYRDENTVLKCELRELQENEPIIENSIPKESEMHVKLTTTENLCDELMQENEMLKADVRELQQEIEEMQDQYREEEIEEFRELQKELETNAKNCRVLQFKLRKTERLKDQLQAEKENSEMKLKEILTAKGANGSESNVNIKLDQFKLKELESELRIAKEVSIRLHTDLEAAEQKRYKMEDEIFYLKEKVRELQTQNKWREQRNKVEQAAKRASLELTEAALSGNDATKELRDVLEREIDLREQLKFMEEDLKRTQNKLHDVENENEELLRKLTKMSQSSNNRNRAPMTRSVSDSLNDDKEEKLLSEIQELKEKIKNSEKKNLNLAKKLLEYEIETTKKSHAEAEALAKIAEKKDIDNPDIKNDITRILSIISNLDKRNNELKEEICTFSKRQSPPKSPTPGLLNKEKIHLQGLIREEQEKNKKLENELFELKQIIGKSDNQKLISIASKVDVLTNKLALANDRYNALIKRASSPTKSNNNSSDSNHIVDALNDRIIELEGKLSEKKANIDYGIINNNDKLKQTSGDEIEECCEVLASIEAQTNRIFKQVEKLEPSLNKEERRRSISKDAGAAIVCELSNVMDELSSVHQLLESHKLANPDAFGRKNIDNLDVKNNKDIADCDGCKMLLENNENQKTEIEFYKKKNKDLTNQVLQTEDRWTMEIEKQRTQFEKDHDKLRQQLDDQKKRYDEQKHLIESFKTNITEKDKIISEKDMKCVRLTQEIQDKLKQILESEKEMKQWKEYEIKYKKLENIYESEKEKIKAERSKFKLEMSLLRKRSEETLADIEKLRESHQRREIMWNKEREKLENEINNLRKLLSKRGNDDDSESESISQCRSTMSNSTSIIRVTRPAEQSILNELREKISISERRNCSLENEMVKIRMEKDELELEVMKNKQTWTREKDELNHKLRQADKIKAMEVDALQQKFTSRMSIMENTNKTLQTQLVQARRERDHNKEGINQLQKKLECEIKRNEKENNKHSEITAKLVATEKKVNDLEIGLDRLRTDLKLSKDAHAADKKLWAVEKSHILKANTVNGCKDDPINGDRKIAEEALKAGEIVQKQYSEYQKFFKKEVDRLNLKIKQLNDEIRHKENDYGKIIKEMKEQIRVLEIDQKNLLQNKEVILSAKETLQIDQERLVQALQLVEVQKLTRKYKLTSVVEQLKFVKDQSEKENKGNVETIIGILRGMRDDDSHSGILLASDSGFDKTDNISDNLSQNSMSIRSINYVRPFNRVTNLGCGNLDSSHRSYSTDNTNDKGQYDSGVNTYSHRSISPPKRYPPPTTTYSVEYDKSGRVHYIPRTIARSASYDRYGMSESALPNMMDRMKSTGTLTDESEMYPNGTCPSRSGSAGTNILYKVRREELAKGKNPSVKAMTMAFESLDTKPVVIKKGFFNIRKSRSVDNSGENKDPKKKVSKIKSAIKNVSSDLSSKSAFTDISTLPYEKSPRGGRNPFKNMGSKLVERVRRSLSRSKGEKSKSNTDNNSIDEKARTPTLAEPEKFVDDDDENEIADMERSCLSEIGDSITEDRDTFRSIQDCDSLAISLSEKPTKVSISSNINSSTLRKVKISKNI
uniref:Protein SOGA3 n=1 Tax=Parastrongyloides trichosuri TaxID=131310 RepID=A0A0N4ZQ97_PARTI